MPSEETVTEAPVVETDTAETPVEAPAALAPFSISVEWKEGATEAEMETAQDFVKETLNAANAEASNLPDCVVAITIRRQ